MTDMEQLLEKLKTDVFAKRPTLGSIYAEHGKKTLFAYANAWQVQKNIPDALLLNALARETARLYGSEIAAGVAAQLQSLSLVSTIDHLGILNHPFFVNSNVVYSLRQDIRYLICLATAGVSMNNQSSWSGCFLYHPDNQTALHKIPLAAGSASMRTVFSASAINAPEIKKFSQSLGLSQFTLEQKNSIASLVDRLLSPKILAQKNFSDQACSMSSCLWREYFPEGPQLICLSLEDVLIDFFIGVLDSEQHILTRLLTTERGWQLIEHYFEGMAGAFSAQGKGSFLFWGVDAKGKRVALRRQRNHLIGLSVSIALTPASLSSALRQRILYPGSLLSFLVLLSGGLTCLGGFNQTSWLTEVREKFALLLSELEEKKLALSVAAAQTQNFAETGLVFLIRNGSIVPASGIDIFLRRQPGLLREYGNLAHELTLAQSIEVSLPEIAAVTGAALDWSAVKRGHVGRDIGQKNGLLAQVLHSMQSGCRPQG